MTGSRCPEVNIHIREESLNDDKDFETSMLEFIKEHLE